MARDHLYRRDRAAGKRIHPGAKPSGWMLRAVDSMAVRRGDERLRADDLVRKAAV